MGLFEGTMNDSRIYSFSDCHYSKNFMMTMSNDGCDHSIRISMDKTERNKLQPLSKISLYNYIHPASILASNSYNGLRDMTLKAMSISEFCSVEEVYTYNGTYVV